jgi:hypothetical protein
MRLERTDCVATSLMRSHVPGTLISMRVVHRHACIVSHALYCCVYANDGTSLLLVSASACDGVGTRSRHGRRVRIESGCAEDQNRSRSVMRYRERNAKWAVCMRHIQCAYQCLTMTPIRMRAIASIAHLARM